MTLADVDDSGNYQFLVLHLPEHHDLRVYTRRNVRDDILQNPMRGYYWVSKLENEEHGPFATIYDAAKNHEEVVGFYRLNPHLKEEPKRSNVIKLDFKAKVRI